MNPQPSSDRAICYGKPRTAFMALKRLHQDLEPGRLLGPVSYGVAHMRDCTANDPPTGAGFIAWDKTIRALRDEFAPMLWERSNSKNFALTVPPGREFAIAVSAGDRFTGDPNAPCDPSTKREKGHMAAEAVAVNQAAFWHIQAAFPRPDATLPTWYLLFHVDEITGEIRAELSYPMRVAADGRIVAWRERIILFPESPDPGSGWIAASDDDDDFTVQIDRIAG